MEPKTYVENSGDLWLMFEGETTTSMGEVSNNTHIPYPERRIPITKKKATLVMVIPQDLAHALRSKYAS